MDAFLEEVFGGREIAILLVQAGGLSIHHGKQPSVVKFLCQIGKFFAGRNIFLTAGKGFGNFPLLYIQICQKRKVV